jgi:hypothetical protein
MSNKQPLNCEVIYTNRISRKSNQSRLEEFCKTANPELEVAQYASTYGDDRNVVALACLLPQHRPENQDNSGWEGVLPEDVFGDWRLDS